MKKKSLLILGAGLTGLSAAYQARKKGVAYQLFEREARPGGLVRSERVGDFTFDYTGHLLHTKEARTRALILDELGLKDEFQPVERRSFVYSHSAFTRAPFQANLYGLPAPVIQECLAGALQAKFQPAKVKAVKGWKLAKGRKLLESFESWNLRTLGPGIYKHFMESYNQKLWGVHPSRMSVDFMGRFVPAPSLERIIEGALRDGGKPMGYNADFIYPKKGGIEVLSRAFASRVAAQCNHKVVRIDARRRQVTFENGRVAHFDRIVSSLPLKTFVSLLADAPLKVRAAAARLKAASVLNVNFGISNRDVTDKQWVYVPEKHLPFYRVGFYHNFSHALAPRGGSSCYAEMSYSRERPIDKKKAPQKVREGLIQMGILKKSDKIAAQWVADIPGAYVVYDAWRGESVALIQKYLRSLDIISTGRWGNWEYAAMEDAIWQGAEAV